ncbi:hypothetical protein EB840_09455 [Klebsiella quasipneumoniae]|nr:hypothetical protein EB840_09455 [Klebsiella quasipneumoniae]PLF85656.1 hypothetical protein B6I98_05535 [Klebsiella quasipneumoniae]PLJ71694.1 hypothetical protein B6J71_15005 [Klebsiella quasipneumoniae]PXH93335.1 hypothetical protein DMQ72_20290 [Klebsiella quasipneumoniae]
MRFVIILSFASRKTLIIRVTKNSLSTVVSRPFSPPHILQCYLFFLANDPWSSPFKTSKRICTCVRLVANVVRWRWLLPPSPRCRAGL